MDEALFLVKRFIKAKTPEKLVIEQVRNNIKTGANHKYEILFDGKDWYAFFNASAKDLVKIKRDGIDE
jgi:hypothetical protein